MNPPDDADRLLAFLQGLAPDARVKHVANLSRAEQEALLARTWELMATKLDEAGRNLVIPLWATLGKLLSPATSVNATTPRADATASSSPTPRGERTIELARTGMSPLVFEGECIVQVWGPILVQNRALDFWFDLALYRAEGGEYAVAIGLRTPEAVGKSYDEANWASDPDSVVMRFRTFNPVPKLLKMLPTFTDDPVGTRRQFVVDLYQHRVLQLLTDAVLTAPHFSPKEDF